MSDQHWLGPELVTGLDSESPGEQGRGGASMSF